MTVLGGWLGAGKTTLVNRLLTEASERIAVIVNDVGDVSIDASLIERRQSDMVELTNGCVCCSLGGSLALTLRELLDRQPRPQRILIEASGIADPAQVARYGDRDVVPLDAIVVVADATDINERVNDPMYGALAAQQLASADILFVSKIDLLPQGEGEAILESLRSRFPKTPVLDTDSSFGHISALLAGTSSAPKPDNPPHAHPTVETLTWTPPEPVRLDDLLATLERLPAAVLRAKGVLLGSTDGVEHEVHLAGRRVSAGPARSGFNGEYQLVLITDGTVELADLLGRLAACVEATTEEGSADDR